MRSCTVCTCCLNAGIGLADEPVAVVTDVRSCAVDSLCSHACVGLTNPPVAVLDIRSFAVGCNSLVSGIFAVEEPVAVFTDVVVKSAADADHAVACIIKKEASACKVRLILTSEVCLDLVCVACEYFLSAGSENELCINVCINVLGTCYHKRPLNVAVSLGGDSTAVYSKVNAVCSNAGANGNCTKVIRLVYRIVIHTLEVRVINCNYGISPCDINSRITAESTVVYSNVAAYGTCRNVKSILEAFCLYVINSKVYSAIYNVDSALGISCAYDSKVLNSNIACAVNVDCASSRGSKSVSVTVEDNTLVKNEDLAENHVIKKKNCVAVICSSKSLFKSSVAYAVDRSNSLYDAVCAVRIFNTCKAICTKCRIKSYAVATAGDEAVSGIAIADNALEATAAEGDCIFRHGCRSYAVKCEVSVEGTVGNLNGKVFCTAVVCHIYIHSKLVVGIIGSDCTAIDIQLCSGRITHIEVNCVTVIADYFAIVNSDGYLIAFSVGPVKCAESSLFCSELTTVKGEGTACIIINCVASAADSCVLNGTGLNGKCTVVADSIACITVVCAGSS